MTKKKKPMAGVLCAAKRHIHIYAPAQPQQYFKFPMRLPAIRLMKRFTIPFTHKILSAKSPIKSSVEMTCHKLFNKIGLVIVFFFCLLASNIALALEVARPAYTPPPPAVSSGSIVQIIFSLLLVLVAIVLVAWLLKRMNLAQQGSGNLLKVLGSVAVGQRERIVLVEVNDTCLVVGIGPGQIRTLHTFQKTEDFDINSKLAETQTAENKFSKLLSSVIGHRKQDSENK